MNTFKRLLPTVLMILFELAIGVMLLINGEKLTWLVFLIFGVFLLVIGLIGLIRALLGSRNGGAIQTMPLVLSVLMIAVGAFFAAATGHVAEVVSAVTLIYGVILMISGVIKLADSLAFRNETGYYNGFVIFSAILSIVLGIVIAFNPFGAAAVIWTILGIAIIVSAAMDTVTLIIFGKALRDME